MASPESHPAPMNRWDGPEAWSLFWEEQGAGKTCLVTSDLLGQLEPEWQQFASDLPDRARVLDLGCGAGTVGLSLIGCRSDLTVVGVDSARVPAHSEPALTLLSSVRMEALPFDADSFDAAVSQFGIEYGDIAETAAELERVLKHGSPICFLVHHCDSDIATDGRMRHAALRALNSDGVLNAFLSGDWAQLRAEFEELSKQYPREGSVAPSWTYFERRLVGTREQREKAVETFKDLIAPDISLVGQLERSCLSADRLDEWLAPFSRMFEIDVSVVRSASGQPIVWKISGRHQRD
jgi:SAM-dependent methyltransferase